MNKYIKTDIENAFIYMKAAIMNALNDIDIGEEKEIDLGPNISWNVFYNCLVKANWKNDESFDWETSGWESNFCTYWISPSGKYCVIEGSMWYGQNYKIKLYK